ncbi:50S ribosomal protein L25/general stress protein Ctc [Pelagibacterales bacterium]|nr:50S ribosomal protein L25/general stress protein Ctc [Pelagibacterales bacterium]
MAKENKLSIEIRDSTGKSAVKKIIAAGKIPSILYGLKEKPLTISINRMTVQKELKAGGFLTKIFSLDMDGKVSLAIPRDVQFHPISDLPVHVDFLRLGADSKVLVDIPTIFINHELSPGLKKGGVLNIVRRTVQINCPANNIPEEIVFDLEGLEIGDAIHISATKLPEGAEPTITDRDFTIGTVAAPTVVKEPEAAAEGEATDGETADGEAAKTEESSEDKKD